MGKSFKPDEEYFWMSEQGDEASIVVYDGTAVLRVSGRATNDTEQIELDDDTRRWLLSVLLELDKGSKQSRSR